MLRNDTAETFQERVTFQPKACHSAGLCVCTDHVDARYFFENIKQHFKHTFWKRKKVPSEPRRLLENGLVFLEFRTYPWDPKPSETCTFDDDWDTCFMDNQEQSKRLKQRLYFYVGHINYSSWHFAVLHMEEEDPSLAHFFGDLSCLAIVDDEDSQAKTCNDIGQSAFPRTGAYSDLEMLACLFDMNLSWSLRFRVMSAAEKDWPLVSSYIPTRPLPDLQEIVVWHGSEEERKSRAALAAQERDKKNKNNRGRKRPCSKPGRSKAAASKKKIRKTTSTEHARETQSVPEIDSMEMEMEQMLQEADMIMIADDADGDVNHSEHDEDIDDADRAFFGEYVCEEDKGSENGDSDPDRDVQGEVAIEDEDGEDNENQIPDADDVFEELITDLMDENLHMDPDLHPEPKHNSAEAAAANAEPAADPAAAKSEEPSPKQRAAPQPHTRSVENREVFVLPDNKGSLRFYHLSSSMVAFCPEGRCRHDGDCRRSATCNPLRRGSGRPIGMLVAWLTQTNDYPDKRSHVNLCRPSLAERQAARRYFLGLPGAEEFAKEYEKSSPQGVHQEPTAV